MNQNANGIGMTSQRTRDRLVQRLQEEGIEDPRILETIRTVPRHMFIEEALASRAYEDTALPIGHGQTISQPYIVALMTQSLLAEGTPKKVLEVGTGSGYQTAVLASLVDEVYTVERLEELFATTKRRLFRLGFRNIRYKLSDGSWGWQENAPYDAIIVTAAPETVPPSLCQQLVDGGRLIIPVGGQSAQELLLITRNGDEFGQHRLSLVNFVPLLQGTTKSV